MGAPLHGLHLPRHLEDLVQRVPVELLRLDHVSQARGDLVLLRRRGGGAGGDGGGSAAAQERGGGGREGEAGAAAGGGMEREVGAREGGASGGGHGRGEARRREGLGFSSVSGEQGAALRQAAGPREQILDFVCLFFLLAVVNCKDMYPRIPGGEKGECR